MGRETNIDAIRALEKQIEEDDGDIIKLKRARNSLLNISTSVPPEILGQIFVFSLVRQACHEVRSRDFGGLQKGSYNFLLVCHHWFGVASGTPELWSFWGNTLQDWKKRHHRSGATPLDLVLYRNKAKSRVHFDESLRDAVRSRVMEDTIQRVHLMSRDAGTLTSIISSLTPDDEGGRNDNIESIVLGSVGFSPATTSVDVSSFFARSRLSRLCALDLSGRVRISSWDLLAPRTTHLTTLSLKLSTSPPSPALTASQLFSILTKNPNLQELALSGGTLPDVTDGFAFNVPLRNLKSLALAGVPRRVLGLLHQLILPEMLDDLDLTGFRSTAEEFSQVLAPYIQEYFRRDTRFQDRLEVSTVSHFITVSITVGVVRAQAAAPALESPRVTLKAGHFPIAPGQLLPTGFITLIPGERVVRYDLNLKANPPEELFFMMPNIQALHMNDVELSEGFLQPNTNGPRANAKLLPSLELLSLKDIRLDNDDWSHLTTYLAHQTSGGQPVSLEMEGEFPDMRPEVVDEIKGLVREFVCREAPSTEEGEW